MGITNLNLIQRGNKLTSIQFDELVKLLANKERVEVSLFREALKNEKLKHWFQYYYREVLIDDYKIKVFKNLLSCIQQETEHGNIIPVFKHHNGSKPSYYDPILKPDLYMDEMAMQGLKRAFNIIVNRPKLAEKVKEVLKELS